MNQLSNFFVHLFDYKDSPPKWHSGKWDIFHGYLCITGDLFLLSACLIFAVIFLRYFRSKNRATTIVPTYFFASFLLLAAATCLLDILSFWYPLSGLYAIMLLITGVSGCRVAFSMAKTLPAFVASMQTVPVSMVTPERSMVMESENEFQLQTIYENAPDAVIVINSKGFIVKWNPAAEKMLGWKEEEVTGKVLNELIVPEEYRQGYISEMKNFLKTGASEVFDKTTMLKVLRKDQSSLIVDFTVSTVKVKDDYLFIGFSRDATERRKGEQALKESEERYRLLTSVVHDYAIIMLSPDGSINSWNEGAQRIKGYSTNEIIGKDFSLFYTKEDVEKNLPMEILKTAKTEGRCEKEGWRVKKDGSLFWANVVITALKRENEIIGFSKITCDNTDKKKAEEQIRQLNALLEQRVIKRTIELQQSEKKYRKLFENSPMPMWVLDATSMQFIDVNEAAIIHYGYSRDEFLSMSALDIRPDHEKKRFLHFDHSSTDSIINTGIWQHLKKDGSIIYAEVTSHKMNIDNKSARLILSIDVTERKKAEERLDFALDAGQIGIWELDLASDISVRNLRHDQIFGYQEAIPGWGIKSLLSHIHPEDVLWLEGSFKDAQKTLGWTAETRIIWPDHSIHWILITGKALGDKLEKPLKMLGTVIDITKLKKAEEEILQLNNELEQRVQARTRELYSANKELESFSYSVSHDLRAPLRAIHGYSKILLEDYKSALDEEGARILSRVMFNAKKMSLLIDDLLEFSRLGKTTLNKTPVDINNIVKNVIGELKHSNKYHQNILISELGCAVADAVTIQLVFQNLLLNATKYSSKKDNPLVEVGVMETDRGTTYFVKDNGAGFNMTYYDKLFGVFQRFHKQEEFEGTGVGLAIVQKIILKHGGEIWANAAVNEGATFYFTL